MGFFCGIFFGMPRPWDRAFFFFLVNPQFSFCGEIELLN